MDSASPNISMKHGSSTQPATNGLPKDSQSPSRPLDVLIVGAGIGGLTAAIALRQAGHHITLLERSKFNQELGAAVHLAPNSNGLLRRYGIFAETFGAVTNNGVNEYKSTGEFTRASPSPQHLFQHPWLLAHRVRLHNALKHAATTMDGQGLPARLLTGHKVVKVDAQSGIVVTENGHEFRGDLIIGADGVHSVTRYLIPGTENIKPFDSGKSAFRFMIPAVSVKDDPVTAQWVKGPGQLFMWFSYDRRLVMYPTNNNEELNFVCIHPSSETNASGDWNNETSLDQLLKVYETFDDSIKALLRKVDPTTLKVWNLLDMEKLPSFTYERMALIGDAAHPFTPHQGQGAGMAIEDAVSIAAMLPLGTRPEEIQERLQLYNKARYERAHMIQNFSRLVGQDEKERKERIDMGKFLFINFSHDEWDHSSQLLREHLWAKHPTYWRQPIAFGPMPGPRQDHWGMPRKSAHSTFTTASIKFKTSATVLKNLFPPGERRKKYSFTAPGSYAYASFSQTTLNKMDWLGGGGYNHLGLYIHGVQYTKNDGTVVKGAYMSILFENLTDPIVSGRDEVAMPKLFSSIDVHRRESAYFINTSWQGAAWATFQLTGLRENTSTATAAEESGQVGGDSADEGIHLWRSMPSVGKENKGTPAEEYPVFMPFKDERPVPQTQRAWTAEKARFRIDGMDWESLPTLHHVVARLAEIPVYEVVLGKVVEGTGVPDVAAAYRIE